MRALLTGATGFVGRMLVDQLDDVVVLSRDADRARQTFPHAECVAWDPMTGPAPAEAFRGVTAVFHLAGESVGEGRWTADKKRRILESRTIGTTNLVRGLATASDRPGVLVSASAIGYYGSRGDELLDETSAAGDDFLADVCVQWERAAAEAQGCGVRVVTPRLGIVLGKNGGALKKMLPPFRFGLGGRLGSGRQWMSWVHVEDVVALMIEAANNAAYSGPVNATAPAPVTNREFTQFLARALHRPALFPAPEFALKLLIGEFAEILLASQRVLPRRATAAGYQFRHATLEAALRAILT